MGTVTKVTKYENEHNSTELVLFPKVALCIYTDVETSRNFCMCTRIMAAPRTWEPAQAMILLNTH